MVVVTLMVIDGGFESMLEGGGNKRPMDLSKTAAAEWLGGF